RDGTTPAFHTAAFTLDAARTHALRRLAEAAGTTLHAPVLTGYHRALAALTGRRDLVLGLAVTGRDGSTRDAHRVFGPFAEAVALRPAPPSDGRSPDGSSPADGFDGFDEDLRRVAAESVAARTAGPLDLRTPQGLPRTAQFFFTFLDFTALGAPPDTVLTLRADDTDTALAPPPVGTDVFLAVRPAATGDPADGSGDSDGNGLRITARVPATALSAEQLTQFTAELRRQLEQAARTETTAATGTTVAAPALDAALVGYLPAPRQLAAYAGLPPDTAPGREAIRALLFPDGRARLLESVTTPLGRSGFVALPLFADELTGPPHAGGPAGLAALTARAVDHAVSLGARSVSLAGMIPALTGYGYDVLRETSPATGSVLTTGHATTTVAVVRTVRAALAATGRDLAGLT
ncbi:condensation domain-containing protein, partial [Streptomyces scabiei]